MMKIPKYLTRFNWLSSCALITAVILSLPILVVASSIFDGFGATWTHLANTVLTDYVINSTLLLLGVAVGVLLIGIPTAWFTSVCDFTGKKLLTWLLLLPLAVPAYIVAYTYTGLLDFAGPVQTQIRQLTGLNYGEYWFFEIRSLPGAVMMLTLVLYPYVYLLARAAFLEQSTSALEVCRTLGYSRTQAFFKLSLPMARPAIIAGLTLALMETLADYGTVQFFGVSTFTTGIFRTFYGLGDPTAAAQLASVLLSFVAFLIILERYSRRLYRYHSSNELRAIPALIKLSTKHTCIAWIICLLPISIGFLIPSSVLAYWAFTQATFEASAFFSLAWNSFYLALSAAMIAVILSLVMAYAKRLKNSPPVNSAVTIAGLGYALPGTIIAIGIIIPLAWLDHRLINFFADYFDFEIGLLMSGTLFALLFAYTVRFLAVSMGAVQSGLDKIKPSLDDAARSLGNNNTMVLKNIHAPLMRSSLLTALLIVFVDVLKELPATLILRPFNFNTLAVHAYELASDERLIDAAPASLMIVCVGLLPVIILSRSISNKREH
ncbi:MAG: ABC-type Fe3+ transport system, permease component [Osedax symbiont Rs1]|nr:MAG: ABC-type Fe3+ transport system, permease component [Osedax symbiont Rs1]